MSPICDKNKQKKYSQSFVTQLVTILCDFVGNSKYAIGDTHTTQRRCLFLHYFTLVCKFRPRNHKRLGIQSLKMIANCIAAHIKLLRKLLNNSKCALQIGRPSAVFGWIICKFHSGENKEEDFLELNFADL